MTDKAKLEADLGPAEAGYKRRIVELEAQVKRLADEKLSLATSEQKFRSIAENSQDYIMRYDRECRHLYENPAALEISGLTEEDIIGKTHREAGFSEALSELWEKSISEVFNTGKAKQSNFSWENEGRLVYLDWCLYPEFNANGGVDTVLGVSRDITDYKMVELKRQAAEQRFRSLFEQSGALCMILDPNTPDGIPIILEANKAACDAHGYTRAEFVGRRVVDIDDEDGKKQVVERTQKILDGKPLRIENIHVRKDGTTFPVVVYADRVDVPGDDLPVVFTTEHDITERRNAEHKLSNSLNEKDILLKEIHHRVKNNLQVVVSLLSLQLHSETDQHTMETLVDSQRRIKVMARLHETLYESGDLGAVNIQSYLGSIVRDTIQSAENTGTKISYKANVEEINFTISQSMALGQILSELLSNCFKHAFAGRESGHIQVELLRTQDKGVELTVKDDGNGFPNNFNVQETDTLGLKLVQGLAQQLRGEISIEKSQGASVKVCIEQGVI
jgi:PAS domain S-box-containing protein